MKKAIKSSAFIFFDYEVPNSVLVCLAVVIVWRVGQYDSGKDDIMMVLNQESDKVDPILMRLS
jgi:hypothetical protein